MSAISLLPPTDASTVGVSVADACAPAPAPPIATATEVATARVFWAVGSAIAPSARPMSARVHGRGWPGSTWLSSTAKASSPSVNTSAAQMLTTRR